MSYDGAVAPFTGAWIETRYSKKLSVGIASLPSRGRGLKHRKKSSQDCCLDVAPFTGAWIETYNLRIHCEEHLCRSLHGGVD